MKKTIKIKIDKTEYELCYTIRSLAMFERLIGKSLTSLFSGSPQTLVQKANIDFTVAGLISGLSLKDEDAAYDLIDSYCKAGGDLDELNGAILAAVIETGLFTPGRIPKTVEKPAKKTKPAAAKE